MTSKKKPVPDNLELSFNKKIIPTTPPYSPLKLFGPSPDFINSKRIIGNDYNPNNYEKIKEYGFINGSFGYHEKNLSSSIEIFKKVYDISQDSSLRYSVLKEFQVFYEFNSKYIIGFYMITNNEDNIVILYEYMNLGSCEDILYKHAGRFPEKAIIFILKSTIKGLLYLGDEHNLLHRNLKPSNILLSNRGEIRLTDIWPGNSLTEIVCSKVLPTKIYDPPSKILEDRYSSSSEIWSLGVVLMEFYTGCFPYPVTWKIEDFLIAFSPYLQGNIEEQERAYSDGNLLPPMEYKKTDDDLNPITLFSLIEGILNGPVPQIPRECITSYLNQIIEECLKKEDTNRFEIEDLDRLVNKLYPDDSMDLVKFSSYLKKLF